MDLTINQIKMLTKQGFIELFWQEMQKDSTLTQEKAYEKVEAEFQKSFYRRRYSSFDSFRKVRDARKKQ